MTTARTLRWLGGVLLLWACSIGEPSTPASKDQNSLQASAAGAAALPDDAAGAGGAGTAGGSAGTGGVPVGPGPAIDGALPPDVSQAWSVAEFLTHMELVPGAEVQLQGYAARVDLCSCPPGFTCSICLSQVALADQPDAGAGTVISVSGLFEKGVYPFEVGQHLAFRGKFKAWKANYPPASAEVTYLSYLALDSAP